MNDYIKGCGPTVAALAISFTSVEAVLRITALLLSIGYTCFLFAKALKKETKGKK